MSTKTWNEAKRKFGIPAEDELQALAFSEQLIKVANAEIKRLVELLQEMHRHSAKLSTTASRIAWDSKEFEIEKTECTACSGSGKSSWEATDICGKCKGAGEVEIVPNE